MSEHRVHIPINQAQTGTRRQVQARSTAQRHGKISSLFICFNLYCYQLIMNNIYLGAYVIQHVCIRSYFFSILLYAYSKSVETRAKFENNTSVFGSTRWLIIIVVIFYNYYCYFL